MSARIACGPSSFETQSGETVLDCLTRNGVTVPHACRSGVCQSCLMHAEEGQIPEAAQKDLQPAYIKQNMFLACQCRPEGDMRVTLPDHAAIDTHAVISFKEMLNHNVMRVRIVTPTPYECEPGQYVTLLNAGGAARSYSVANNPQTDHFIELHVRLLTGGVMSAFFVGADPGESLIVRGPAGKCFYVAEGAQDYPLILAGTGTGLAPLYGILQAALAQGHKGSIHLFHGVLNAPDLYLHARLQELATLHPNVSYTPCVLNGADGQGYFAGQIETAVLAAIPAEKAITRLFLCGAPEFVNGMRRKAFLAGLASKHIFADPFLPAQPAAAAA
ncbi:MAG: FAD-binding oxidoreductase [Rhodospirillaceae bacterium]